MNVYRYEIEPRPAALGGVRLYCPPLPQCIFRVREPYSSATRPLSLPNPEV